MEDWVGKLQFCFSELEGFAVSGFYPFCVFASGFLEHPSSASLAGVDHGAVAFGEDQFSLVDCFCGFW